MDYPGVDGFLGTRASIMLDVVFIAMFAIVPTTWWSIWLVKHRQKYLFHKRIQVALLIVLGLAVGLFEIDVRFVSGWRERAEPSPYYASASTAGPVWDALYLTFLGKSEVPGLVFRALAIHLVFAVSTTVLWTWVGVGALRRFSCPPLPNEYSRRHRLWGQIAAWDMMMTAVTGWIFYWLAFVA